MFYSQLQLSRLNKQLFKIFLFKVSNNKVSDIITRYFSNICAALCNNVIQRLLLLQCQKCHQPTQFLSLGISIHFRYFMSLKNNFSISSFFFLLLRIQNFKFQSRVRLIMRKSKRDEVTRN
jgi:large-conductance mechanosensitive channel